MSTPGHPLHPLLTPPGELHPSPAPHLARSSAESSRRHPPAMRAALLLVDIQYDFLPPAGALAVPDGDSILEPVYRLLDSPAWTLVVASQDFHPRSHISFASRHSLPPFTSTTIGTHEQELWPDHCVQGTRGCELESGVAERLDRLRGAGVRCEVVRKGTDPDLDAYSAFASPQAGQPSPLAQLLLAAQIDTLLLAGLATDFCVRASALDALALRASGWNGRVLLLGEGVRGVRPEREGDVLAELECAGAELVGVEEWEEVVAAGMRPREGERAQVRTRTSDAR